MFQMPHLIIRNVWAVGMHHHGPRFLEIGDRYELLQDTHNRYDKHAIKITSDGRTFAYLNRSNARVVSELMGLGLCGLWLLKPKETPEVQSYKVGPQQRCNIGYTCKDIIAFELAKAYLDSQGLLYEVIEC